MDDLLEIEPGGPVKGTIRPPGSKSITNRALVCAALAEGTSHLRGALDSEDTRVMLSALQTLGISCSATNQGRSIVVSGCGGEFPQRQADLFVANSGTTIRFLTAMLSTADGEYVLDGIERMRQRPIGDLLTAINALEGNVAAENGFPPVHVGRPPMQGGAASIGGSISSQYLSGLLMAAPYARQPVRLDVEGELVSQPYVEMTRAVMREFGVSVKSDADLKTFEIPVAHYLGCEYDIEPDASAASYFWGAAAVTGGQVAVTGLSRDALQGDVAFCDCLAKMGCSVDWRDDAVVVTGDQPLRGIDVDMNAISDTVQTLGVVALFADGPTTIRNVSHIRHKETDRIGDLACELRKLGATVDELTDGLRVTPSELRGTTISTYNDHRMAMSFALAGLRVAGVVIADPRCTEKTYPNFFDDLDSLRKSKED